jgi:hypothetical protein
MSVGPSRPKLCKLARHSQPSKGYHLARAIVGPLGAADLVSRVHVALTDALRYTKHDGTELEAATT